MEDEARIIVCIDCGNFGLQLFIGLLLCPNCYEKATLLSVLDTLPDVWRKLKPDGR